jgi:DNA-directed RNA polymerase subunit omega
MMLYPSMSTLLKNINSRYLLVNVTAKRARQIALEAEEHRVPLDEKPVKLAILEIANCRLTLKQKSEQ